MRRASLIALCVLAGANSALAAGATTGGAQTLADTLHRYLGPARAGQADFVRVEPSGDAYRVTLDIDEFIRPLEAINLRLDTTAISFLAQPLPEGTWRVSGLTVPTTISLEAGEQSFVYRFDGIDLDGVFDPALAAFSTFQETVRPMSAEVKAPGAIGMTRYGSQTVNGTATAAGEDAVDVAIHQSFDSLSGEQHITPPATETDASPAKLDFSYELGATTAEANIHAFKSIKLFDLWAYAVARLQETPPKLDNAEVKRLLGDLLPVFGRIEESVSLDALKVTTPAGEFGLASTTMALSFTGIAANGDARMAMKLSGPSYPDAAVPEWARKLVPTDMEMGFELSGYDLDAPARLLIDRLDVASKPPIADADFEEAARLVRPVTGVKLELSPTSLRSPLLGVEAEGAATFTDPAPSGAFKVTVTGLDECVERLSAETGDPAASQVLATIQALKVYAEETTDGADFFAIELRNDGAVTVNGSVLKPPSEQPL